MLHAGGHVIMRVWCVQLNGRMQMSAAAVPACKGACEACLRCACCTYHAWSALQAGLSSVESTGWCRRGRQCGSACKFSMFATGT